MPLVERSTDQNIKLFINTRRYLLLSIVLVWGAVALVFFAIKPQVEIVFSHRTELNQEKDQYQALVRKVNELKQIEISQQFQQKDKVDEVLPSHKPVLELLTNLYQSTQRANVSVSALRINPGEIATESAEAVVSPPTATGRRAAATPTTRAPKAFDSLKLDVTVIGDEANVDEFIELVERIAPFTSIVELSIKRTFDREQQMTLTEAEMLLNTYYYTQTITSNVTDQLPSVGEKELKAFNTIQEFMPSGFVPPSEIESANLEDLFGVQGLF